MALHRIKRGLQLPIAGAPAAGPPVRVAASRTIGIVAEDFVGLRPTFAVREGDMVARGQVLFADKHTPAVTFTAPAAGRVIAIHRGAKRAFESLVIALSAAELAGDDAAAEHVAFASYRGIDPRDLSADDVRALLLESGQWIALRQRPFSRVADPARAPASIFVTAIDTHPHAPHIDAILRGREADLERGLVAIGKLTDAPVFVCTGPDTAITLPAATRCVIERFEGPHPAGTVGLHIHRLDPVDRSHIVWHLGVQDVIAIGRLFATGRLAVSRIGTLAGPAVRRPRLIQTRLGASIPAICEGELLPGEVRLLSGSVLDGRRAVGPVRGFLGRYHQQIAAIHEQRERELFGWLTPGRHKFSVAATFLSKLVHARVFPLGSSTGGSSRPIVPLGLYEKVLPLDLEPAPLLKALMVEDVEWAETLGCLELDEEDLALCSFVCPSKADFGERLRAVLTTLEADA